MIFTQVTVVFGESQSLENMIKKADSIYFSDPYRSYIYCYEVEQLALKENNQPVRYLAMIGKARFHLLVNQLVVAETEIKFAMNYFKKSNDILRLATAYNLMSVLADKRNNRADMYFYCNETIRLYKQVGNILGEYKATSNLALAYLNDNKLIQAEEVFKALEPMNEKVTSSYSFYYYLNYGNLCSKQERFEEALKLLEKAVEIAIEIKMMDSEITALTFLGSTLFKMGNKSAGLKKLELALEKALEVGLKGELRDVYLELQKIYTLQKNETKLEEVNQRIKELDLEVKQDSIVAAKSRKEIELLEAKKEKEIRLLDKEKQEKISNQQGGSGFFSRYWILIVAGFVIIGVILFLVLNRNNKV